MKGEKLKTILKWVSRLVVCTRWFGSFCISYSIHHEAGIVTAVFSGLVMLHIEITHFLKESK